MDMQKDNSIAKKLNREVPASPVPAKAPGVNGVTGQEQKHGKDTAASRSPGHRAGQQYTVTILAGDSAEPVRQFHLTREKAAALFFAGAVLTIALVSLIAFTVVYVARSEHRKGIQEASLAHLTEENARLRQNSDELEAQVAQLSVAFNASVSELQAAEEAAEAEKMPTGFPINSSAQMTPDHDDPGDIGESETDDGTEGETVAAGDDATGTENDTDETENETAAAEDSETGTAAAEENKGNPIVIFQAEEGARVISSGSGEVIAVTGDHKYGNMITLDHGNGYISIYRNAGDPLVKVGDQLRRGDVLYLIGSGNRNVGYQIQQNDAYLKPEEVIEIHG